MFKLGGAALEHEIGLRSNRGVVLRECIVITGYQKRRRIRQLISSYQYRNGSEEQDNLKFDLDDELNELLTSNIFLNLMSMIGSTICKVFVTNIIERF